MRLELKGISASRGLRWHERSVLDEKAIRLDCYTSDGYQQWSAQMLRKEEENTERIIGFYLEVTPK